MTEIIEQEEKIEAKKSSSKDYQKSTIGKKKKLHLWKLITICVGIAVIVVATLILVSNYMMPATRKPLTISEFSNRITSLGFDGSLLKSEEDETGGYSTISDPNKKTTIMYVYAEDKNSFLSTANKFEHGFGDLSFYLKNGEDFISIVKERSGEDTIVSVDEATNYKYAQNCQDDACITRVFIEKSLLCVIADKQMTDQILKKLGYN